MKVIIDGDSTFAFDSEPEDVLSAVAAISTSLREKNRAIVDIRTDGKSIKMLDARASLHGLSLSKVGELSVRSESLTQLVTDCLKELQEVLPELPAVCHSLAALFQGEHPDEGYEPFTKLVEIWGHVKSQELLVVQALDLTTERITLDGKTLEDHHRELNEYLTEAEAALKERDGILLGDLLEYELAPRAEKESMIVALLQERARERV